MATLSSQHTERLSAEPTPAEHERELMAYERIARFSELLAEQGHAEELFEVLVQELSELTRADHALIISLQGEQRVVRAALSRGDEDPSSQLSDTVARQVIEHRKPVVLDDLEADERFNASESIERAGLNSVMCAPLMFKRELLGIIYVGSTSPLRSFGHRCLRMLESFSAQAAILLKGTLQREALQSDNQRLRDELEVRRFGAIIGSSPVMSGLFERVERVAATPVSVLILGETGTGKELIARELHARSDRASGPFVAINCGAIPHELIETELFGHVKGAFTHAHQDKLGSLRSADRGTLFLDELGEMPLMLQVKLLRVLQEREVTPVGSHKTHPLDVRLICATQVNLLEACEQGTFREDLYYRVSSFTLTLPPLRARGDDVILIARYLVQRFAERYELEPKELSEEACALMKRYPWPGNIRELENRVMQALILSSGEQLTAQDLQLSAHDMIRELKPLAEAKEAFTHDYIEYALSLHHGNRTRTAAALQVDPRTIFRSLVHTRSKA